MKVSSHNPSCLFVSFSLRCSLLTTELESASSDSTVGTGEIYCHDGHPQ